MHGKADFRKKNSEASPLSIIYTKSIQVFFLVFEIIYFSKKRTISDEVSNLVNAIKIWHLIGAKNFAGFSVLVHSEFLFKLF